VIGSGTRNAPLLCKKSHLYKNTLRFVKVRNLHDGKHAYKWLRWPRGSVLPLSTQVHGFHPGRSRQDFSGRKNPQHAFLRRGSKAVGPMSQICSM